VLRLVDCEQGRRAKVAETTIAVLKVLLREALAGRVSRALIVYDNGPETEQHLACANAYAGWTRSQLRETLAMLQQEVHSLSQRLMDWED
jgi:hypothetical protein